MSVFDYLFPKRCIQCKRIGEYLCATCFSYITFTQQMICAVCQKNTIDGLTHPGCLSKYAIDGIFSSVVYKGVVKKIVYQFKYPPYLSQLQESIVALCYEGIIQNEMFMRMLLEPALFIPIPIHESRMRKRGYNQATYLASGLSDRFAIPVCAALSRIKNTKTQVGLTKDERKDNIRDAFLVAPTHRSLLSQYQQVFLVDDVATSGATLLEAAKVLKKQGVSRVYGVTFAHGE